MADESDKQIELAAKLQLKLLEDFEKLFNESKMTAADRSTLARLLLANGWSLDPNKLPGTLRDKLTKYVDPRTFDENDPDLPLVS